MEIIERAILEKGRIINNDILKVDSFLNHQIDPLIIEPLAKEIAKRFPNATKVLTIETSGIAIAYAVSLALGNIPLVFAKKSKSAITGDDNFMTEVKSFTRGTVTQVTVDKKYLNEKDNILIVDDFLAEGNASLGLLDICKKANAKVCGVAVAIEKYFQGGRDKLEKEGLTVFSGAAIKEFKDNKPEFIRF